MDIKLSLLIHFKNQKFLLMVGVIDLKMEHKTIELCLRKPIGAFLFNWILRCNHHV